MAEKQDYYELLSVARGATATEIRKAYKKLALKHHPDRNQDCAKSAQMFKEVTEAYTVLSDDEKRARYDQFGHAGLDGANFGNAGDIFSQFQDLFSDFFGGMGGFAGGGGQQRRRGANMRIEQILTLEEAALGVKKELTVNTPVACDSCKGTGAKAGTQAATCHTCDGRGQVSTGRGFIMFTQTCPTCQGEGRIVKDPCGPCGGSGLMERERKVMVSFPAGIDAGHRLRVAGQGMPSPNGGPAGHLYVDVALHPHERFERDGDDLIVRETVAFPDAALGTTIDMMMLDGSRHTVKIKAGTQPGTVITMPGLGVPRVQQRGAGALHVVVQVAVPRKLSRRAKKLLRELEGELQPLQGRARVG